MAGAYSQDVPDRVIDAVIGGKISRRAAAARFGVSLSSAIKWVQRFERTGSRGAATMAGYKRVKVEPRRGVSRGSAGRETRHHAHGAVREAFNRARRQGGHLDDEPVPPPDRRHAQTKTLIARATARTSAVIGGAGAPLRSASTPRACSFSPRAQPRPISRGFTGSCAARRAVRRHGPAWALEHRDLSRRPAQHPHRGALPVRRSDQRRALSRLERDDFRPDRSRRWRSSWRIRARCRR